MVLTGLSVYLSLFFHHREVFDRQNAVKTIFDLISHVPEAKAGPGAHIFAGVSVVGGIAVGLAAVILDVVVPTERSAGTIVSLSSLILGVVFSAIALWTLWQTRRLDFQLGFQISGFHDLIVHINKEIKDLIRSVQSAYAMRPQPFHRVYLVTTNPFFGRLSHPHSPETTDFLSYLFTLAQFVAQTHRASVADANAEPLVFKIICGTSEAINNFHREFYGTRPGAEELIARADDDAERAIREIDKWAVDAGADPIFCRKSRIPRVQFMIAGNTLYEFTMDSVNNQTEIYNTNVSRDSRYCNAFIDNFGLLLNSSDGSAPSTIGKSASRQANSRVPEIERDATKSTDHDDETEIANEEGIDE